MRKVYHNESKSLGLVVSFICSLGLTVVLFGTLPFAHRIGRPDKPDELVKAPAIMEQEDEKKPTNQDAIVIPIYWMGQLVCSNRALQGKIVDATST